MHTYMYMYSVYAQLYESGQLDPLPLPYALCWVLLSRGKGLATLANELL